MQRWLEVNFLNKASHKYLKHSAHQLGGFKIVFNPLIVVYLQSILAMDNHHISHKFRVEWRIHKGEGRSLGMLGQGW